MILLRNGSVLISPRNFTKSHIVKTITSLDYYIKTMKVTEHIAQSKGKTLLSYEIIPPQKGHGIGDLYKNIDPLMEFKPSFIDVTTSRKNIFTLKRQWAYGA